MNMEKIIRGGYDAIIESLDDFRIYTFQFRFPYFQYKNGIKLCHFLYY